MVVETDGGSIRFRALISPCSPFFSQSFWFSPHPARPSENLQRMSGEGLPVSDPAIAESQSTSRLTGRFVAGLAWFTPTSVGPGQPWLT